MSVRSLICHACRSSIRLYSTDVRIRGSDHLQKDISSLFGPREIYDTAHTTDKVLSIPYEAVLDIPRQLEFGESDTNLTLKSDDLLVVSKIMRRAPRPSDKTTLQQRLELARRLCHASAVQGNTSAALFWSEEILRSPSSSASSRSEAMTMLTKLAKEKHGKANYLIANELFSLGQETKAMQAYRLAGEQGVAEAFTKLGRILRQQGYHKNSVAAFKLAAEAGEPNAQFMMSTFSKNEREKIHYLQKAAAGGKEEAAHNLGEIYRRKGQNKLAKEYLEIAARKGFQISQMNLAGLLRDEKDLEGAEAWYAAAVKAGGEVALHAEKLLLEMKGDPEYSAKLPRGKCIIM